ncbi:hypothetical protein A7K93_02205 [Candidatus Methylacidiphilum fumarolicum]|uniref:hypothetical protein n=1 Tax=Candidatus Methylacidiphilum fumarolicum TaxID=591154 RepID=UPI0005D391DF|nr:hypothetical protein [Candidatus Methylacidiphilum fumarolicum]TFE68343.1 hypothetical protein A7K73_01000 [Candidatus Methylacidiphilum fumarolicum]TFE73566.1 hypothetical protein A7K72_06640 [Candidatus Methylacidiphilum fumarolicum]TFE74973.1 hypothetical protein A7K93_02205 [Candidatus Methylacidiphilum fumarolicum]TFE76514.1 hypothetical protein A7D33_09210 [Candidatus Methylacidiphilum fumarolicum]
MNDKCKKVVARRLIGLGLAFIGLVVAAMMTGGNDKARRTLLQAPMRLLRQAEHRWNITRMRRTKRKMER